jgi:hypothetical protein
MLANNLAKMNWFMDDLNVFFDMEWEVSPDNLNVLWQDFILEILVKVIEA